MILTLPVSKSQSPRGSGMNHETGRSNDYEQHPEPVEVFGYRRFESAQDFPQPPPSTQTKHEPALDFYQPTETDDWVEGLLKNQYEHDNLFEDLPGTFVGMATTLSPPEKPQFLEEPLAYNEGQSLLGSRGGGDSHPPPRGKHPYGQSYSGLQQGYPQITPNRTSLGDHQPFESFYGNTMNSYDNTPSMTQNGQYYFPTPPVSSHIPSFFDSNGGLGGRMPISRTTQTPQRLQFGSDARFEGQGFMAPQEQESEEALVQRRIDNLECLKPDPSPASTHPPSPMLQKRKHSQIQYPNNHASLRHQPLSQETPLPQAREDHEDNDDHEDSDPTPKRRRKAVDDEDLDFQAQLTPARIQSKRSKPSNGRRTTDVRQGSATNTRADSARQRQASVKNNRQVLTDEQKKTNHIISEQKRRDLIKRGYEGIQVLVPALKNTKTSKGGMLESAADWLDDILQGNEMLRQQLASLTGGNSGFA